MEPRKGLVAFLQSFLAQVKEVDKWRVDSEEGIGLLQHHLPYAGTLTPVLQLLLQSSLQWRQTRAYSAYIRIRSRTPGLSFMQLHGSQRVTSRLYSNTYVHTYIILQ